MKKSFMLCVEGEGPKDMNAANGPLYKAIESAGLFLTKAIETPDKATIVFINDSPWVVVLSPSMVELAVEACKKHVRTELKWTMVLPEDAEALSKTGEDRKFGARCYAYVRVKEVDLR